MLLVYFEPLPKQPNIKNEENGNGETTASLIGIPDITPNAFQCLWEALPIQTNSSEYRTSNDPQLHIIGYQGVCLDWNQIRFGTFRRTRTKKISASAGRLHLSPRKLHLSNSGRLGPSSLDTDRHGSRTIQLSKQPVYLPQEQGWKTLHSLFHLPMESSVIAGRYQQSLFIRPPYRSIHNLSGAATSEPFRNHTHGCFKRGKASVLQQMGRHLCYRLADRKNE